MDGYLITVLSNIGMISFVALSAYILLLSGQISFGQQAYFGIGAYTAGIATVMWQWPLAGALVLGALVASAAAGLVGLATLRLSDAEETRFFGAFRHAIKPSRTQERVQAVLGKAGFDAPCVLMVGFEGFAARVKAAWRSTLAICTRRGGLYVGRGPGNSWYENRFEMPYLRDPLMDRGIGVDTLETSTTWSNLHHLYEAVGTDVPLSVDVAQRSGSRDLDRAAVDAVRQWRFVPARRGEEPIAASVVVPIVFSLDG